MITAYQCRTHAAECMALGMQANLPAERVKILTAMARSWTTLAEQMERYDALLKEEAK